MGKEEAAIPPPLHFLFVSFPGQGHVNPLLRLAKRVAAKGPLVTFSTTSDFGARIRSSEPAPAAPLPVGLGSLRFEFLPDCDAPRDISDLMTSLRSHGPPALSALIRRQSAAGRPVSCLVSNPFIPWALDVAEQFAVPSAVLWIQSSAVFSIYRNFLADGNVESVLRLPGIPAMRPDELPTFLLPSNPYKSLTEAILAQFQNIGKARWVFANSFLELERGAFDALGEVFSMIPVGPLVDAGEEAGGEERITADLWKAADYCVDWLGTQEVHSVVYVSVGSVVKLSENEMAELAFGLRNSGRPFLWVVRNFLLCIYFRLKNQDLLHLYHNLNDVYEY